MVSAVNELSSSLGLQQQQYRTVTLGVKILLIMGLEDASQLVLSLYSSCERQSEET